jgi:zinc protease
MPRLIAALLVFAAGLFAQPKIEFEHYQLPNGMQVILHPEHTAPLVHLNLRFAVGSKHEAPGRSGFAHLFEHLMGENADAAGGYVMVAEAIGATSLNAGTHADYTDYYETVPASRLERMLWLESNQWVTLPQRLTQERFAREREIVINERRERIDNQPYAVMNSLVHRFVFPPGHPYSHDAIGTPADLMAASLDDVRAFYQAYYTPDNASLVVSGDFDRAQTKSWIAKYFGSLAPGPGLISPASSSAPMAAPKIVEVTSVVPYSKIVFAWAAPGVSDPDNAALEFAQFILDERWHEQTFRDRIQFDPSVSYYQLKDASAFSVINVTNGKIPLERVRSVIVDEIERFAREGPSTDEVERARNNLESQQLSSLEDLYGVSSTLNEIQQYYGGVEHFNDWAARYWNITSGSVRKAVSRWLLTPNALTIKFTPITARHDNTPEPDRNTPPPFQPEKPFRLPEIKSTRLPNGLQIFVVERHGLPKVSVELRLNLGSAHAPAGKPATALVTMLTFACGTPTRTDDQIKKEIMNHAVSLTANADAVSQYISFEVLRKNFEPMLALLSDALFHPVYPKDVFERRKNDVIEDWERHEGHIDEYAYAVGEIAYGPTHPLGASSSNPEALRDITVADVQEFTTRFWHPDVSVMVFAGDITIEEAAAAAARYLGEWKGWAEPPGRLPPAVPMKGRTFLLERKGVTQTTVVMILPGIAQTDPDYPALMLADKVFGGGFFSRLYRSIRLDRGITYTVSSNLATLPEHGLWTASSPVQADKTREAMAAFAQELRGIAGAQPITQAELDAAKQNVIRSWPVQFQWNSSTAGAIANSWVLDKSLNDLKTFQQRIAAVTLDQVNAAAHKYAQPDKAVFLLVGDPGKIGAIEGLVTVK